MKQLISKCPSCNGALQISTLQCPDCGMELKSKFEISIFNRLDDEQYTFLLSFLKNRGSLKELQADLQISYPTAKKRLDDLLVALGFSEEKRTIPEEEIDMNTLQTTKSATKASEIVRNKFIETVKAGKPIIVYSYKGIPYELHLVENGNKFDCPQLIPYSFDIFDIMVDVMVENGGKARKGYGRKRLGDVGCEENTIAGAILKNYYGVAPGGAGLDPGFVMASILEWAGIATNERGYLKLTPEFKAIIKI